MGVVDSMMRLLQKLFLILLSTPRIAKYIIVASVDICFCILTVWLAFYLRLGEFVQLSGPASSAVTLSVTIALPIFLVSGLYRSIFRHSGLSTLNVAARAIAVYGIIYFTTITSVGFDGIPRTIGVIQPLLLFLAIGGARTLVPYWIRSNYQNKRQIASIPRALIYGAGNAGRQLMSALENSSEIRVKGFLDDDVRLTGRVLNGQPVFSPDDLNDLIKTEGITHVLLAIPSANRRRRNEVVKKMSNYRVVVRTLPSMADLANGNVTVSDLCDLGIDDLLGRPVVAPDDMLLTRNINKKVVLVAGAGGSIGSELCRQIIRIKPKKLLLVDISEFALYAIHSELETLYEAIGISSPDCVVPLLASVQDETRMREIMETWLPETVYHAAAYKHVPLVEHNVAEGVKNNVIGTLTVAKIAIETGSSNFVLISTDKAVRPTNVMGASKRLAEISLQALCASQSKWNNNDRNATKPKHANQTKLSMVRFGNVLDSSGSVIPKFRKQISSGGPVTLTHSKITRYFMTIPEAAQLVIQAGAMAKGGDVFVLDMGEPIKIADLAIRMIELSGLQVRDNENPDGDIEIVVTGLRPGEKLYEELLLGDDPLPTIHPKIQSAQDPFIPWNELESDLDKLAFYLNNNDLENILEMLQNLVTGYHPNHEAVDWVFVEHKSKQSL